MKKVWQCFSVAIGPAILVLILANIELNHVLVYVKQFNVRRILFSIFLVFLFHLLKAFRWKRILRAQTITLNLVDCYWMYLSSLFWGIITPGRLGDFSKAWYLHRMGVKGDLGVACSIIDRVLDMFLLGILGLLALAWFSKRHIESPPFLFYSEIIVAVILGIFLAGMIFFSRKPKTDSPAYSAFFNHLPVSFRNRWYDFRNYFRIMNHRIWIEYLLLTMGGWLLYFYSVYMLIQSSQLPLTLLESIAFFIISTIVSLLPISIAGIGTRDACLLLLFKLDGYTASEALTFSLCILFIYIVTAIFGLLGYFVWHSKNSGSSPKELE